MNRLYSFAFFSVVSFILIVLQSTLLSPEHLGVFYPDLSLLVIIFVSVFAELKVGALIAFGNAYTIDVLSGYLFPVHTLSRFGIFVLLRGFSESVYAESIPVQALAIFLSTVFSWLFVWSVVEIRSELTFLISPEDVLIQGIVNVLAGLPLFWILTRLHARVQT